MKISSLYRWKNFKIRVRLCINLNFRQILPYMILISMLTTILLEYIISKFKIDNLDYFKRSLLLINKANL